MSRKQRHSAASPKDYIPFGKPEEVVIEHVEAEKVADGRVIEARYVERFRGASSASVVDSNRFADTGDFHRGTCKGKRGVATCWEKDGRFWCRGCWIMYYGSPPKGKPTYRKR
jgi:hypothetical protein